MTGKVTKFYGYLEKTKEKEKQKKDKQTDRHTGTNSHRQTATHTDGQKGNLAPLKRFKEKAKKHTKKVVDKKCWM